MILQMGDKVITKIIGPAAFYFSDPS